MLVNPNGLRIEDSDSTRGMSLKKKNLNEYEYLKFHKNLKSLTFNQK